MCGTDPKTAVPSLYWIDHLSSMCKLDFCAHGYYHKDLNLDEAKVLMKKCFQELKVRFLMNLPTFVVKVTTKDGTTVIEL